MLEANNIYNLDCLNGLTQMENESVQIVVTSPPYFQLRDYGVDGQVGIEKTPEEYVRKIVKIFCEVKRVLKKDGTLWIVIGDSYNGSGKGGDSDKMYAKRHTSFGKVMDIRRQGIPTKIKTLKPKDLIGIPWKIAFALQADGWYLRQDIIWHKPNPMPESIKDRCTKSHEYIFLLSKSKNYYYNSNAIMETAKPDNSVRDRDNTRLNNTPGRSKMAGLKHNNYKMRNKRSVWTVNTQSYKEAHFAVYPEKLIIPCIRAGSRLHDVVLDPFMGSGTTAIVCLKLDRKFIGFELSKEYCDIAQKRIDIENQQLKFNFDKDEK